MAKQTGRQRKQIIAEYTGGGISQRLLAGKYPVSQNTTTKLLNTKKVFNSYQIKKKKHACHARIFR